MQETTELLQNINWFLKPISDTIIYLFTTTTGIILLASGFGVYVLASLFNALWVRQLAHRGASNYGRGHLPFLEKTYVIISELGKILLNVIYKAPVLLGVFLFLLFIVGFSTGLQSIDNFISNQKKIKELKTVVKHLDKRYKVADMVVTKQVKLPTANSATTTMKFNFYDDNGAKIKGAEQEITIKGNDIYFDALVLNFEYSEIGGGKARNLVVPLKVFSNEVPKEQGVALKLTDQNGVPFIFKRSAEEVYGMPADTFNVRLREILTYIKDQEAARQAGVRSIYGNAVHVRVWDGYKETIWIEQTGGLVIKPTEVF